jgi:hypothetical protein|tara:strand:- start:2177 stop:2470 length:294 start_codon:yes stop_codon:yes gene_type:complete
VHFCSRRQITSPQRAASFKPDRFSAPHFQGESLEKSFPSYHLLITPKTPGAAKRAQRQNGKIGSTLMGGPHQKALPWGGDSPALREAILASLAWAAA